MKRLIRCLLCTLWLFPAGVRSQTAAAADSSVRYFYQPVTILATRYAEPWIQVPFSLSYIQQQNLPAGRGYGLDEVLSGIPGVLAQSRAGSTDIRLSIRGFGARGAGQRSNAGTSRGVRVLTDGFPETEPDGRTSFDMIDLSGAGAIEVMRSNASSLYGNASGGVINVMSNTMFDAPYAAVSEGFGSFGYRKDRINAGANLGTGKMYFSMSNTNSEGWRFHSQSAQTLLNTGILARLGDRTSLGIHLAATDNLFRIPGALTQAQYDSLPQQADSALFIRRDERRNNRMGRIGITATHEPDDQTMLSASAFVEPKFIQRSERNQFREFNRYHVGGSVLGTFRMSFGPGFRNTLLVGGDEAYQDGAIAFYNRYNISPAVERGTLRDSKREAANNLGAFLQDELQVGERWLFLAGVRYDDITYQYESFFDPSVIPASKSFEHATPKLGITYKISPTHTLFANLGGGVEAPAGNETDADPLSPDAAKAISPVLEPITSTTIEAGTKQLVVLGEGAGPFANLSYDAALYWLRVTNDIIPYSSGTLFFTAGRTERMGLEFGGSIQFRMGLSLNGSLTASDNKYKEYLVDSLHYGVPGKFADYAGKKVVGIPDLFYSIGAKYRPEPLREAFVSVNLQRVGGYFVNDANTIEVPSYAVLNVAAGIDQMKFDRLFVGGFIGINNVTGLKYIGSAWLNPDLVNGRPVFIEPGLPRNVVGSVSLGWNF